MTVFKDVRTLVKIPSQWQFPYYRTTPKQLVPNNSETDVKAKQTEVIVVDQQNVKAALIDSEYYSADEFTGLQ